MKNTICSKCLIIGLCWGSFALLLFPQVVSEQEEIAAKTRRCLVEKRLIRQRINYYQPSQELLKYNDLKKLDLIAKDC